MLPRPLRLTSASDHRAVLRRGRRAGGRVLTVHLLRDVADVATAADGSPVRARIAPGRRPARAGLVVGKVVGDAVTRHRVSRQLRHLLASRMAGLPPGARLVVRAGTAAAAPGAELARELDAALDRLTRAGREQGGPR